MAGHRDMPWQIGLICVVVRTCLHLCMLRLSRHLYFLRMEYWSWVYTGMRDVVKCNADFSIIITNQEPLIRYIRLQTVSLTIAMASASSLLDVRCAVTYTRLSYLSNGKELLPRNSFLCTPWRVKRKYYSRLHKPECSNMTVYKFNLTFGKHLLHISYGLGKAILTYDTKTYLAGIKTQQVFTAYQKLLNIAIYSKMR